MRTAIILVCVLAVTGCQAKAQDTFVPIGLKSSCEWRTGRRCVARHSARRPARHAAPVRREVVVLPPSRSGKRCWPVTFRAYSDEKVAMDGKKEAVRRWSGIVRSELGELFMDFDNAVDRTEQCWQSSTGERLTDKVTGGNERCMVEARPCRAERTHVLGEPR